MNLVETAQEQAFREWVRGWVHANLQGEFAPLRGVGAMGSRGDDAALVKRWEQQLASGGWIGLDWPRAHGGQALPLAMQLIFHEEYARCGGPAAWATLARPFSDPR